MNPASTPDAQELQHREDLVCYEDIDLLAHVADILQHFDNLTRIAVYATAALLTAVSASLFAICYASFLYLLAVAHRNLFNATLHCISIFHNAEGGAPVGVRVRCRILRNWNWQFERSSRYAHLAVIYGDGARCTPPLAACSDCLKIDILFILVPLFCECRGRLQFFD